MLLTTTEHEEDVDYEPELEVPEKYGGDMSGWHSFGYGELFIVISHEIQADSFLNEVSTKTWALHTRTQKLVFFTNIELNGWMHVVK